MLELKVHLKELKRFSVDQVTRLKELMENFPETNVVVVNNGNSANLREPYLLSQFSFSPGNQTMFHIEGNQDKEALNTLLQYFTPYKKSMTQFDISRRADHFIDYSCYDVCRPTRALYMFFKGLEQIAKELKTQQKRKAKRFGSDLDQKLSNGRCYSISEIRELRSNLATDYRSARKRHSKDPKCKECVKVYRSKNPHDAIFIEIVYNQILREQEEGKKITNQDLNPFCQAICRPERALYKLIHYFITKIPHSAADQDAIKGAHIAENTFKHLQDAENKALEHAQNIYQEREALIPELTPETKKQQIITQCQGFTQTYLTAPFSPEIMAELDHIYRKLRFL